MIHDCFECVSSTGGVCPGLCDLDYLRYLVTVEKNGVELAYGFDNELDAIDCYEDFMSDPDTEVTLEDTYDGTQYKVLAGWNLPEF